MTEIQNLNSITIHGVEVDYIPQNYNLNVDKQKSIVSQKVLEQAIDKNKIDHHFEFNKKHETNMVYDSIIIKDFDITNTAYDITYNMKFTKNGTNFEFPSDYADEVNVSEIYLTNLLKTKTKQNYTLTTGSTTLIIPDTVKTVKVSDKLDCFVIERQTSEPLTVVYPKMKQSGITDTNKVCKVYINNTFDNFYTSTPYACNLTCGELYLSSKFFKGINLTGATPGDFGNFENINVNKLYIEEDGLNTTLAGDDLIDRLETLLQTSVDLELY